MKDFQAIIDTPFAQLAIQIEQEPCEVVTGIDFFPLRSKEPFTSSRFTALLSQDISAYLQNPYHKFETRLVPHGTEFQQSVWRIMQTIDAGKP